MSDQADNIIPLLERFGFSPEEAVIYLVLLRYGALSVLRISRKTKIGRTKVYRILDKLVERGLVSRKLGDWGMRFAASDPVKLEFLAAEEEARARVLRNEVGQVVRLLREQVGKEEQGSKVLFYEGESGLLQVNYNLLRAKGEFLSLEFENANVYLQEKEAEDLRRRFVERGIRNRMLSNRKEVRSFTKVDGYMELVEMRWIEEQVLKIRGDVFIYNEVVAMCNYLRGEVFCVEIYNRELAQMQKEMFELLWRQADKVQIAEK